MSKLPGRTATIGFLLVFVILLPSASASSEPVAIEFATPAQTNGNVTIAGLQWALIVFSNSSDASLNLEMPQGDLLNHTRIFQRVHADGLVHSSESRGIPPRATNLQGPLEAGLDFQGSWSSLYIEADSLDLKATQVGGSLERADGTQQMSLFLPERPIRSGTFRMGISAPFGLAWGLATKEVDDSAAFTLEAVGVRRAEWHNAAVHCQDSIRCPDGARDSTMAVPIPGGYVETSLVPYVEVVGSEGKMQGQGDALAIAVGGATVDAALDGWLRLPAAILNGPCPVTCQAPARQTFQAQGEVVLKGLTPMNGSGDRATAGFQAHLQAASFDESPADSLLARGTLTGAALAGVAGLWALGKVLAGLFARNSRPLLDNPKAKTILDLVLQNPGISFSSLEKAAGIGHGTMQYHVKRLLNAGLIVAYSYGKRVRYYENHGRHAHDWREHAALQKPELRRLHQWLTSHPRVTQAFILQHTAEWGWKRSATQKYLGLLHGAQLVSVERTSAAVEYIALRPRAVEASLQGSRSAHKAE